jgi:hypothetical protein
MADPELSASGVIYMFHISCFPVDTEAFNALALNANLIYRLTNAVLMDKRHSCLHLISVKIKDTLKVTREIVWEPYGVYNCNES